MRITCYIIVWNKVYNQVIRLYPPLRLPPAVSSLSEKFTIMDLYQSEQWATMLITWCNIVGNKDNNPLIPPCSTSYTTKNIRKEISRPSPQVTISLHSVIVTLWSDGSADVTNCRSLCRDKRDSNPIPCRICNPRSIGLKVDCGLASNRSEEGACYFPSRGGEGWDNGKSKCELPMCVI